jgi:hypothetical protein
LNNNPNSALDKTITDRPDQFSIEHLLQIAVMTAILMSLQSVVGPISPGFLSFYFGLLRLGRVLVALFSLWMALGLATDNTGWFVCGLALIVSELAIGLSRIDSWSAMRTSAKGQI